MLLSRVWRSVTPFDSCAKEHRRLTFRVRKCATLPDDAAVCVSGGAVGTTLSYAAIGL